VGEALISTLDEKGTPTMVERVFVIPPHSHIGPVTPEQKQQLLQNSIVAGQYETPIDRESAFEMLKAKSDQAAALAAQQAEQEAVANAQEEAEKAAAREERASSSSGSRGDSTMGAFAKSAARAVGSNLGRQIVRGVLGSIFGGGSKRKSSWF
jgi:hypothetical protein